MINEEVKKILLARIDCMERQMAGCCSLDDCDDLCCHLLDEQGTPGEFIDAMKKAYKVLIRAERENKK